MYVCYVQIMIFKIPCEKCDSVGSIFVDMLFGTSQNSEYKQCMYYQEYFLRVQARIPELRLNNNSSVQNSSLWHPNWL